ncbi:MAG: hypothetical protein CV088_08925 [Nitrospira sp. LK70]|nr:hypothetical protein [Nitrospira sp. LK70]
MLTPETLVGFAPRKSIILIAYSALLILPLMSAAGCADDGGGGPMVSSLSTPTDATAESDSDQAHHSAVADAGGEEDPVITMTPTAAGVTAHVTWDRPSDFNATGYYIFYGKRSPEELRSEEPRGEESLSEESSPEEPTSCSRGESQAVEAPPATIAGLEPNTPYFFAIRAVNDSESICSNEITMVTPSVES